MYGQKADISIRNEKHLVIGCKKCKGPYFACLNKKIDEKRQYCDLAELKISQQ